MNIPTHCLGRSMTTQTAVIEGDTKTLECFLRSGRGVHGNGHTLHVANQSMFCIFFLQSVHADVFAHRYHTFGGLTLLIPRRHHLPVTVAAIRWVSEDARVHLILLCESPRGVLLLYSELHACLLVLFPSPHRASSHIRQRSSSCAER